MMSHPPIPPDSMFFHCIEVVDEPRKHLKGLAIFSPYKMHKDVRSWSHDSDFPWFLESMCKEEKIIVQTMANREWVKIYNNAPSRLSLTDPYDRTVCSDIILAWENWEVNDVN